MSRTCSICGRGSKSGVSRSHSNIATLKKVGINVHKKKVNGKRIKVCTKCVKTKSKTKK